MKDLKEIRQYLDSIPDINRGGCLVAAFSIYLYLKKNGGLTKDFRIIEIDEDMVSRYQNALQYLKDDYHQHVESCGHAVIFMNGKVYDSTIDKDISDMPNALIYGVFIDPVNNEQKIIDQINNASWNESFDRKRWIPEIAEYFDIDLSMMKLSFKESERQEVFQRHTFAYNLIMSRKVEENPLAALFGSL